MRIVAGSLHGRRIAVPPGDLVRPTSGRLREALFNILAHGAVGGEPIAGAVVLDAFAGTGALGLEALSRGAASVSFFEQNARVRAVLAANIAACGATGLARIVGVDATHPPAALGPGASLVFLDPPYGEGLAVRAFAALKAAGWIAKGALIVVETARRGPKPPLDALGELLSERVMGAARVSFWRA